MCKGLWFILFVLLFPQLVAGGIEDVNCPYLHFCNYNCSLFFIKTVFLFSLNVYWF